LLHPISLKRQIRSICLLSRHFKRPPPEKGAAVQPDSLTLGGGTAALAAVFVPAAPPPVVGPAAALGLAFTVRGRRPVLPRSGFCRLGLRRPALLFGGTGPPFLLLRPPGLGLGLLDPLSAFGSPSPAAAPMPAAWLAVAAAGCADLLPHGRLFQLRVHIEGRHQGRGLLPELLRLLRLHIAGGALRNGDALPAALAVAQNAHLTVVIALQRLRRTVQADLHGLPQQVHALHIAGAVRRL
ncbi:tRNA (Adenine(22)-N(1))-methyltransferase, partial [Dysosmobacter welbionis]